MVLSVVPGIEDIDVHVKKLRGGPVTSCRQEARSVTANDNDGVLHLGDSSLQFSICQESPHSKCVSVKVSPTGQSDMSDPTAGRDASADRQGFPAAYCTRTTCKSGKLEFSASAFAASVPPQALPTAGPPGSASEGSGVLISEALFATYSQNAGPSFKGEINRQHRNRCPSHYQNAGINGVCCCGNSRSVNGGKGGQNHGPRNSPLFVASGSSVVSHWSGVSHHCHPRQRNSVSKHHNQGTNSCSRRCGFGAAAVEAIRSRIQAGATQAQLIQPSSSVKHGRQCKQLLCGPEECRPHFQVPLPRSRAAAPQMQFSTNSTDAVDAMVPRNDAKVEHESVVSATHTINELNNSTYRLLNVAPLFDRVIQQLITECDRRVANASAPMQYNHNGHLHLQSSQKRCAARSSVTTHSFDMLLTPSGKTPPMASSKVHSFPTFATERVQECEEALESPHYRKTGSTEICNTNTPRLCCLDLGSEGKVSRHQPMRVDDVGSGLFRRLSGDAVDVCVDSSMVQQLIVSVGSSVSYGESAPLVLISTLIYLSRIALRCDSEYSSVTAANWYRLTAVALLLATKMYVDGSGHWNECFSNAANIPLKELNKLEIDFLFLLDFDMLITEEEVEVRAEWMDAVASKHNMMTPLRTFVLEKTIYSPSTIATPVSSMGDEVLFRSLKHTSSGNVPSTPLLLTPPNMTPSNGSSSPFCSERQNRIRTASSHCGLEGSEKQQQQTRSSYRHHLSSPLCVCEAMSPLPPPTLCARSTERLFSVAHGPLEPMTPPSIRDIVRDDVEAIHLLTPPDQIEQSPIFFFCATSRSKRCDTLAVATEAPVDSAPVGDGVRRSSTTSRLLGTWKDDDDMGEDVTPPHPRRCILSPPTQEAPPLPPPRMADFRSQLSKR